MSCEILMQFDRLYFSMGQIEAEIWDFWSFGSFRALPDIWTGQTHLGTHDREVREDRQLQHLCDHAI